MKPKSMRRMRKDILLVLRHSHACSGSCNTAYLGCGGTWDLRTLLAGHTPPIKISTHDLINNASESKLLAGWGCIKDYLPAAEAYFSICGTWRRMMREIKK